MCQGYARDSKCMPFVQFDLRVWKIMCLISEVVVCHSKTWTLEQAFLRKNFKRKN